MATEDLVAMERGAEDLPSTADSFRQTLLFPDQGSAMRFLLNLAERGPEAAAQGGLVPMSIWDEMMEDTGAVRVVRSHQRKETRIYRYQHAVHQADLEYLEERDPTANMLINDVPRDAWADLPQTDNEAIDEFFAALVTLGYPQACRDAHALARRDGMSLLYWVAGGKTNEPVVGPPIGFEYLERSQLEDAPDRVVRAKRKTPLLPHGIDHIVIKDDDDKDMVIHGSRLQLFKHGRTRSWKGIPALIPVYDDVWNLRDHVFALTRGVFEGDPLAFEFVTEAVKDGGKIDLSIAHARGEKTGAEELQANAKKFITGALQVFSPVQGITVKRVGGAKLPDPEPSIRLLVSRISQPFEHTFNHIHALSRGSEQVQDGDDKRYAFRVGQVRTSFCVPLLRQAVNIGKFIGDVPSRAFLNPKKLRWPELTVYNIRERAHAARTFAMAMEAGERWGRKLPVEIEEMFPEGDGKVKIPRKSPSEEAQLEEEGAEREKERAQRSIEARLDSLDIQVEEVLDEVREMKVRR